MASSHFSASPKSPLREEVQFPTVEPQRRPQKLQGGAQAPTMAKHGRSSSFFPNFFVHRSQNSGGDQAHQRTVSLDSVGVAGRGTGASTRTSEGSMANGQQFGQTQTRNHHSAPYPQPDTTPDAMVSQQQRNGAGAYQQPLPQIPPASQPDSGGAGPGQSQGAGPGPVQATPGQPAPLHPEIRSVVGLTAAHAHKIYFSGPLVRRIERQPDGQRPHKDDGWTEVWAQLGGTTLSIWDMKEVQEASRQGTEVPPIYVNITDAFIQVLGSVTVPATATSPPKRYVNVLTLNTAGSNLLLFSCPSTDALISWASALRLSAWEKSRLEEIYTAHLIRITLKNRDYPTPLARGKLEGWAQIRIAGQTDWKRVWLSISEGSGIQRSDSRDAAASPGPGHQHSGSMSVGSKNRLSKLFGNKEQNAAQNHLPTKATIFMYSGMKPKERKKPLLTLTDVSQAFAVYPERPELIPRSTLIKVEGTLGEEEMAQSMKSREGWILIMPLMENLNPNTNQSTEMLKWVVALHDAFGLYGRPQGWTWDPRDPQSLMFGYPVGIQKELLFLDRESAEKMDPRIDRTSAIRYRLREMLIEFMRSPNAQQQPSGDPATSGPPSLPPIPGFESEPTGQRASPNNAQQFQPQRFHSAGSGGPQLPQLPPLSFGGDEHPPDMNRPLTPITERDSVLTHPIGTSGDNQQQSPTSMGFSPRSPPQPQRQLSSAPSQEQTAPSQPTPGQNDQSSVLGRDLNQSPLAISPTHSYGSTSILSGTPQLGAPATGGSSQTSFSNADKGAMQAAGRSSVDSTTKTNGGATRGPLASPTKIQGSPLTHRPGGSFSSTAPSTPPLPVPKDNVPDPQDRSEDRSMFNQRSTARTESPQHNPTLPVLAPALRASSSSASDRNDDLVNEAGAMFFMQQHSDGTAGQPARQQPVHFDDEDRDDYDSPSDVELSSRAAQKQRALSSVASDTTSLASSNSQRQPVRKSTPMAFNDSKNGGFASDGLNRTASPISPAAASAPGYAEAPSSRPAVDRGYATAGRSALGRKPSGARAPQPTPKGFSSQVAAFASSSQLPSQYEEESEAEEGAEARSSKHSLPTHQPRQDQQGHDMASHSPAAPSAQKQGIDTNFDDDADTLAALAYLDVSDPPQQQQNVPPPDSSTNGGPPIGTAESLQASTSTSSDLPSNSGIKSSFAPSRKAEERKKKAQAQQAAQQAAVTKPGRANGRRRTGGAAVGAWGESSDEEEEEEEEEDDEDVDSDGEPSQAPPPPRMQQQQQQQQAASMQQPFPQSSVYPSVGGVPPADNPSTYSHNRPPRTLPQPPAGSRPGPDDFAGSQMRLRTNSDQYAESGRRTYFDEGAQPQPRSHMLTPGAARQNVWSQVLDAGAGAGFSPNNESTQNNKDTFVQLDTNEKMTKAFTPQGLLSAGMQDKQDRSAKRQEELARETGASLINVPNKPPPPQTGLLGAITSHERERKREGGLGAALTEREREKRVAEERQRRFDEQQRQQLDQMQQGGSMYGAPYGFNPMMNPMMMGMNPMMGMPPMAPMAPMMTGGNMMPGQAPLAPMMTGGGMNPMMTGGGMNPMMGYGMFNPQHMFAAQQAAQAYQNAMIAFSVAGSQVGGDGGNGVPGQGPQGQGMMGGNMSTMGGFDPRMSMNLMGMQGMMGGMPMMNPGPLGAQNTGMSQFDPRFGTPNVNGTPSADNGNLTPPNALQNLSTPGSQLGSGHNSPIARGSSPLRQSSRPASPK